MGGRFSLDPNSRLSRRRFTSSSRRPVRSRIIQALLYLFFARPRSREIESRSESSDQPARCEFDADLRPLPFEAGRAHRFRLCPCRRPCSLRRTGIRQRAGLGNAGRLSVANPDSDSSFCRASAAALWRVQRYAKKSRDEGSVTQCRRARR